MEAREQDPASAEEAAVADTAAEVTIAPEAADTAESSTQQGTDADAPESGALTGDAPATGEAGLEVDGPPGEAEAEASEQPVAATVAESDIQAEAARAEPDAPLELVELELALSMADIPAAGFDMAMRAALASAGGTLLFIMPAGGEDASVAALSLGSGELRETFLAILAADGETVRFERASDSRHPVAGLAASWTRVMERMPVAA